MPKHALSLFSCLSSPPQLASLTARACAFLRFLFIFATTIGLICCVACVISFLLFIFATMTCLICCTGMRFPSFLEYLRHHDLLALSRGHALSLFSWVSSPPRLACFVARACAFSFFLLIFATTNCLFCYAGMRFSSFPVYLRRLSRINGKGILDSCDIACPKVLLQRIYGQRDLKLL